MALKKSIPTEPDPTNIRELIPRRASLSDLQEASQRCRACDLWKNATQAVFGEGAQPADIMLIGEQPGDQEDRSGHPFVGPAGKLLDQALTDAGIDRSEVYVTNVVKHFRWTPTERGKRRIHKKPRASEIQACRPWLDSEFDIVKPKVVICLGASAAQAILGKEFRVTRDRRRAIKSTLPAIIVATVHPSSILRARDDASRQEQLRQFVDDLRAAKWLLESTSARR